MKSMSVHKNKNPVVLIITSNEKENCWSIESGVARTNRVVVLKIPKYINLNAYKTSKIFNIFFSKNKNPKKLNN
jgi:hypothetical protein